MWRTTLVLFLGMLIGGPISSDLDVLQKDAEKALGRQIRIQEVDQLGENSGRTRCDANPVLVEIVKQNDPDLRKQVLAHELGHALLCAQGLFVRGKPTSAVAPLGLVKFTEGTGRLITNCYIDPLVDKEVKRRGFKPEKMGDNLLKHSKAHPRGEIHEKVTRYGPLATDLFALGVYCAELDYGSSLGEELEHLYSGEPLVMNKIQSLRTNLGKPKCIDAYTCFVLTKRLRDEFGWDRFMVFQNPKSGQYE